MKWPDPIRFNARLREVRLSRSRTAGSASAEAEQAAYDRGHRDGERALGEQMLQQRADLMELHQGVVASLRNAIPRVAQETEKILVELALEAAQKIVAGMPIPPKMVEAVVREAVSQAQDHAELTVQLHPEDLALLRKVESPILHGFPEAGPLRFVPSNEVTRGGCLILTRFGIVDARRETKIEQLRQSLAA